jgi:hypothetical protein
MGNQASSNNENNESKIITTNNLELSDFSFSKSNNSSETSKDNTTQASSIKELNIVKTYFEWRDDGKTVFLTGSFANWNQFFQMNKYNDKFELILVYLLNLRTCQEVCININSLIQTGSSVDIVQLLMMGMEILII